MLESADSAVNTQRYAKCIEVSKRIRWDIDRDLIRGREFDFSKKFLPDGLSKVDQLPFLSADQKRFYSHVQGRTYANMFALVNASLVPRSPTSVALTRLGIKSHSKRWFV